MEQNSWGKTSRLLLVQTMFDQYGKDTTSRLKENISRFINIWGTWGKFEWHIYTVKVLFTKNAKHIFRVFVMVRHVYNGGNLYGMYVQQIE